MKIIPTFPGVSERSAERGQLAFEVLDLFKREAFSFWQWDQSSNLLTAPGFFTGTTLEDWIIRIHPRDQADFSQFLDHLIDTGESPSSITYRIRQCSGNEWIKVRQTADPEADSSPDSHCCLIELVSADAPYATSLDKLEGELNQGFVDQIDEYQTLASMGKLAGGIAHDFNNALTVIQGHTMLLEQSLRSSKHHEAESLELLKEATDQAAGLAKQLLRVGNQKQTVLETCDLNQIIENFMTMIRRVIEETIELNMDIEPHIGMVKADPIMLGQVLMNLMLNARDAVSNSGGKITIKTQSTKIDEEDGPLSLGSYIELSITDNGVGIPRDTLSKIFTPYFSTKGRGTGLGLANVANIVEEHGGTIDVTSTEGKGSTFTILLPVSSASLAPAKANPPAEELLTGAKKKILEGTKILLVEDESAVRMLVRKLLEMLGCSVIEAESGRQALDLWPDIQDEIALVVSDVVMPEGVSGWDLARELRKKRPEVGILLTSGYCENPEDHNMGDDSHVAFLQKPYASSNLETTLSALLAS
ncbi:ATP-binding protein [Verrucomicrobiales bacterium BCK34]|nr:ATP-binding protein [Verrucomicrobiales bacterium BCK34]